MKNKKLVVAVAAALTAASAVPALALENQFTGSFTTFFDTGNFASTGVVEKNSDTANFFVQRMRLGYTAKADDHVKLVTKFEFDYNYWGNSSYVNARGGGGALGADTVNMETKNIYLDLNYPSINAKIGMMPNTDSLKGILFDADMAGILVSHDYSNASVSAGFFRFNDKGNVLGDNTEDMVSLDAKYSVSKNFKVGAAYYFIKDNRTNSTTIDATGDVAGVDANGNPIFLDNANFVPASTVTTKNDTKVHTLGINAEGVIGPVSLSGFAAKQFGDLTADMDAKGYAFNLGAKMALAGGTARTNFLYVSGGKDAFYVATNGGDFATEGGQFYDSEMIMLGRDKWATTIDNALIYDVNNNNEGVIMGTLGYDYDFSEKVSAAANVGFAATAKDTGVARHAGDSNYLGTEFNAECYYKVSPNVTLGARGGYLVVGDYFAKGSDNLWDMKALVNYSF
ncbi:alginate export family protein [Geomonas oryzae]|uniref:porin n=1 Tax=Geomonas oryzae TaxID=2364273 RepID=UPI00100B1928|nr:porin [Geomonas oryzae]